MFCCPSLISVDSALLLSADLPTCAFSLPHSPNLSSLEVPNRLRSFSHRHPQHAHLSHRAWYLETRAFKLTWEAVWFLWHSLSCAFSTFPCALRGGRGQLWIQIVAPVLISCVALSKLSFSFIICRNWGGFDYPITLLWWLDALIHISA